MKTIYETAILLVGRRVTARYEHHTTEAYGRTITGSLISVSKDGSFAILADDTNRVEYVWPLLEIRDAA